MNNNFATTGLLPFTINSTELFTVQAFKDQIPWTLTGGSAMLRLSDPNGNQTSFAATISGSTAAYNYTVVGPPGTWTRAWDVQSADGIRQVSRPIAFTVASSPS